MTPGVPPTERVMINTVSSRTRTFFQRPADEALRCRKEWIPLIRGLVSWLSFLK